MTGSDHPVVRAAAEALAKEFAGGRQDGGLYRHFIADDGYGSFCSASPSEAAAVAAPAALRAAADIIEATYPPDVFLPDGQSPDARAAAGARVACNRMRHMAGEIESASGRVEGHTGSEQ
jgi:hypothetical protein